MNRDSFIKLLNSNGFSYEVFREAAKLIGKEFSSEMEDTIRLFMNTSFQNFILEKYQYAKNILIKHFQVNSIKSLQSNQVIKYY